MDETSVGEFKWCGVSSARERIRRGDLLRSEFVYHKRLMMHEWRGSWFEGLEAPRAARGIACPERSRRSARESPIVDLTLLALISLRPLRSRSALIRIMSYDK